MTAERSPQTINQRCGTSATGGALLLLRQDHDKTLTSDVECRRKKGGEYAPTLTTELKCQLVFCLGNLSVLSRNSEVSYFVDRSFFVS